MKNIFILLISMLMMLSLKSQQVTTITASGFTFSPAEVTVNQGDIVRFNVGASHPVLQVSQSTWDVNGSTPLPGGFSFPAGTGDFTASAVGTFYYICTIHISMGMKGKIIVNASTGFEEAQIDDYFKIYPIPANEYLIFQKNSPSPVIEIRIFDITGRNILVLSNPPQSDDEVRIDIKNLIKGVYFLNVKLQGRSFSGRFLKSQA